MEINSADELDDLESNSNNSKNNPLNLKIDNLDSSCADKLKNLDFYFSLELTNIEDEITISAPNLVRVKFTKSSNINNKIIFDDNCKNLYPIDVSDINSDFILIEGPISDHKTIELVNENSYNNAVAFLKKIINDKTLEIAEKNNAAVATQYNSYNSTYNTRSTDYNNAVNNYNTLSNFCDTQQKFMNNNSTYDTSGRIRWYVPAAFNREYEYSTP